MSRTRWEVTTAGSDPNGHFLYTTIRVVRKNKRESHLELDGCHSAGSG